MLPTCDASLTTNSLEPKEVLAIPLAILSTTQPSCAIPRLGQGPVGNREVTIFWSLRTLACGRPPGLHGISRSLPWLWRRGLLRVSGQGSPATRSVLSPLLFRNSPQLAVLLFTEMIDTESLSLSACKGFVLCVFVLASFVGNFIQC